MAIELVTGHTGTEHVTAAQAGLANAGVAGTGMYVLDVLQKFKCTVASANSVTIGTGMARINGRDVASESATSLSVASGVSGQNRRDLVVARYSKATSTGVESVSLAVIKGTATTGTPSDPSYNTGSIIDGKTTVDMPLWRLPISGVSVGTPVQLFTVLPSLKALGDSVSQVTSKTGDAWHDVIAGAVQYRYIAPGTCLLHVKNMTLTGGKLRTVGQLPTAYRPSVDRIGTVSEAEHVGLLFVRSGGNVDLYSEYSGDYSGFVVY